MITGSDEEQQSSRQCVIPSHDELEKQLVKLRKDMDEDRKQVGEYSKQITAYIEKWHYNKERDTLFGYALDLITILYNKIYQYAISQGLSPEISISRFIRNSKQSTTGYITASLNHLGVSLEDYTTLRTSTLKRIRSEDDASWDTPDDMLMSMKWTTNRVTEFIEFVRIVETHPGAFDIDYSDMTGAYTETEGKEDDEV